MQTVPDLIDSATTRSDESPVERVGTGFIPMDLSHFAPLIALPLGVTPIDAWGPFLMFFLDD